MKRIAFFTLICVLLAGLAYAAEDEIPEGMSVAQDGVIKVLVPQDAQSRQERNLTVYEGTDAYISRSVLDMKQRIADIEASLNRLEEKLEELSVALKQLKDKFGRIDFE